MPKLRLRRHQATFSDEDILLNPSDFNGLKLNDIVELKPPKDGHPHNRILLQVRKWQEANSYPNSVSIKDTVALNHLKLYSDVLVNVVEKKDVLVDSVEICFGNAYLARSYMWGLRNHLNNRCVYERQKLDYLHIRSQVCEIWAHGRKVSSGYVDDDTKIVFRSASSLVYLFIQMSSEMWDYDINGDLYCEKAINGFLTDLFDTWRRNDCSHDITIILFSRTFYDAESIEEFPKEMRECLQRDYEGRLYEDCYRVAFQNDRFDLHDWNAKLTTLKSLFNQYQKEVIDRHQDKYDIKIPRAYNSSASQGNFLEVLNMSLNVFEKHYFDRSFDRTGQLSVVVSPGVGVFEVDFEMTNLTKQRIIDNGIGSDLVCLGEQPLHTVPLLKFNSKNFDSKGPCDVYNMPHWINLSFYASNNQVYYSNFIPRIKLPTLHSNKVNKDHHQPAKSKLTPHNVAEGEHHNPQQQMTKSSEVQPKVDECLQENSGNMNPTPLNGLKSHLRNDNSGRYNNHVAMPDLVDYDDYDSQVFKPNPMITYEQDHPTSQRGERSILSDLDSNGDDNYTDQDDDFIERDSRDKFSSQSFEPKESSRSFKRQMSDNLPIGQSRNQGQAQNTLARMSLVDSYLPDVKMKPESADDLSIRGYNLQSSRTKRSTLRPKALINPFDPSHMTIKLTPNRRRWTHVFPQGPMGTFIQQHHYQAVTSTKNSADETPQTIPENALLVIQKTANSSSKSKLAPNQRLSTKGIPETASKTHSSSINRKLPSPGPNSSKSASPTSTPSPKSTLVSNDTVRFAWCASGEQEWTPAITTGVDWKSLTMPACLPLTTDFFPSKTSLQNDYVIGEYNIDSSCIHQRYTLIEVYRELVCQRLQKGFQIILLPRQGQPSNSSSLSSHKSRHKSSSHRSHHHQSASPQITPVNDNDTTMGESFEHTMSIGRIFHKLSLNGNTITITQYRPRHPYPTIKIDYCYRFRAPFHDNYIQSWVHFKSEKLENYSWNYLDNYICARGESFELRSSLQFWRFRILILPSQLSLQKLHDNPSDIVNGENRLPTNYRRHDIFRLNCCDEERAALMESFAKLLEIINKTRRASACRVSSMVNVANQANQQNVAPIANKQPHSHVIQQQSMNPSSPNRLNVQINSCIKSHATGNLGDEKIGTDLKNQDKLKLRFESINMDIDSALRDARRAEWVHVQYHNYYEIDQAFELVIKWMVASGAGIAEMVQGWARKVGNSSVHVVPIPWEPFAMPHSGKADPLRCPIGIELRLEHIPNASLLTDNQVVSLQEKILRRFGFLVFYDLISTENIERQFIHMSGFAFVALPNIVADYCSLDHQQKSSFEEGQFPLANSPTKFRKEQQQPVLLTRSNSTRSAQLSQQSSLTSKVKANSPSISSLTHQETVSSPHEEYITRHIGGARRNKSNRLRGEHENIEFIWSWNYMLTKRWRSSSTQDESYAVSLMQDFKSFCQNGDDRLVAFWHEIKDSI